MPPMMVAALPPVGTYDRKLPIAAVLRSALRSGKPPLLPSEESRMGKSSNLINTAGKPSARRAPEWDREARGVAWPRGRALCCSAAHGHNSAKRILA